MVLLFILSLFFSHAWSQVNIETHDFSFEYGLAYHTLKGEQKRNNTKGQLTSPQNPFYNAAYTFRTSTNTALKFFGGVQLVRFDSPLNAGLKNEDQVLNHFGLELITRTSPISKFGIFLMQQDHPLYFAKSPTELEVFKKSFAESGLHWSLGQRRRVGLLWGLGAKGFLIFPTKGGNASTESGVGAEGYGRLGWVGPLGTLFQVKGFYQATTAPNAEVSFTHEILGYCFLLSFSY